MTATSGLTGHGRVGDVIFRSLVTPTPGGRVGRAAMKRKFTRKTRNNAPQHDLPFHFFPPGSSLPGPSQAAHARTRRPSGRGGAWAERGQRGEGRGAQVRAGRARRRGRGGACASRRVAAKAQLSGLETLENLFRLWMHRCSLLRD